MPNLSFFVECVHDDVYIQLRPTHSHTHPLTHTHSLTHPLSLIHSLTHSLSLLTDDVSATGDVAAAILSLTTPSLLSPGGAGSQILSHSMVSVLAENRVERESE